MKESELQYYRAIGKIQAAVSTAKSFDDAIRDGLKILLDSCLADYAVVWYCTKDEPKVLRPYYWLCPADLTSRKYAPGEGIVGRVFSSGTAEVIRDFRKTPDEDVRADFGEIPVSSLICAPFSCDGSDLGCIELLRAKEGEYFSDKEEDAAKLLILLTQMAISESAPPPETEKEREVLISVKEVHKYFDSPVGRSHVLRGVNLDVFRGEFLCFLGESGCGKSTMLNIIGGMIDFDGGSVTFAGEDIAKKSRRELTAYRRDNIGFIFQSYNLMPNLNAKQNLELIAELVKEPMDADEALALVGLSEKANRYPSQLSGGQQQRISIARALVKRPKVILADEPTAALDYATSIEVLEALEDAVKSGTTLIMVTHNEEITKMADRVIRFRGGRTYEVKVNKHRLHAKDLVW